MAFASSAYASASNLVLGNVQPKRSWIRRIAASGLEPVTYVDAPDEVVSTRPWSCPSHLKPFTQQLLILSSMNYMLLFI